jgi:integrase
MGKWFLTERGQQYVKENKTMAYWFSKISSLDTKNTYGHTMQQFCESIGISPDRLMEIRTSKTVDAYAVLGVPKNGNVPSDVYAANGYAVLDRLQQFLQSGEVKVTYHKKKPEISKVNEYSKKRRECFYATVKSFFMYNRADLPSDRSFKITENSRTKPSVYLDLDQARRIIGGLKEPYYALVTAALYGGLGVGEMALLNTLWPAIKKQLDEGNDPVRVDFSRRKTNQNPYFTLVPAKIFKHYSKVEAEPFRNNHDHLVTVWDIQNAFNYARKRVNIEERVTPHMIRDLFRTKALSVGMQPEIPEFMMGHTVDRNGYLQISREPEKAVAEWKKLERYLDSGVTTEQEQRMREQEQEIRKLKSTTTTLVSMAKSNIPILENQLAMLEAEEGSIEDDLADPDNDPQRTTSQADLDDVRKQIADTKRDLQQLKDQLKVLEVTLPHNF